MWYDALWSRGVPIIQWSVVLLASLAAARTDWLERKIPNWLTGPVFLSGLLASLVMAGWGGLMDSLAAGVILAFPYVVLFVFAGGGAGDAKLMASFGAWLGVRNGLALLFCVAVCGILYSVAVAVWQKKFLVVVQNLQRFVFSVPMVLVGRGEVRQSARETFQEIRQDGEKIPYGLAICLGAFLAAIGVTLWRL